MKGVLDTNVVRLKALFRARAIRTTGGGVYQPKERAAWVAQLPAHGARLRAETLYAQLDVLRTQRKKTKAAMVAEAKRDPAFGVLETIPYFGPVRIALLLATIGTPWRFRTKRNLWAYAGLAVVTRSSSDYELFDGRPRRRRRPPLTRGLNRNHNRVLKNVFKGAANVAIGRQGPFQDFYHGMLKRGMREELARVTLARKLAALTLRLLKTGEVFDPTQLSRPQIIEGVHRPGAWGAAMTLSLLERRIPGRRRGRQSQAETYARLAVLPRHDPNSRPFRRTRRSVRPAPGG